MKVTSAAKALAENNPDLTWPGLLPQHIYDLDVPDKPFGSPMPLGENFHGCLEQHLSGKWVTKNHYYTCSGISEILADLGLDSRNFRTEIPVSRGQLRGQVDLVGIDRDEKPWVIEIKTTQCRYNSAPSTSELCQLALYADLLDLQNPTLACIRINFSHAKVSVFYAENGAPLVSQVKDLARLINLAA